ncbi:MAG: hypothetical protein J5634_04065 [Bacilli bacterium]|nr:hypothetical protein [Bacilli bacterium]
MKKIIITFIITLLLIASLGFVYFFLLKKDTEDKTKYVVTYTDASLDKNIKVEKKLDIEYGRIRSLSDFVSIENGTLNDFDIVYDELGKLKVEFSYINNFGLNHRYITLNIVDTTAPYVSVPTYKTVLINSDIEFIRGFFCADNHDKIVERSLEGDYDFSTIGTYNAKYVAKDISGNKSERNITINVVEKMPSSNNNSNQNTPINYLDYQSLYNQYKTKNTKIGIDISRWQGDVDFAKLKESNVEFIMIRLGGQDGIDGEYYTDSKFKRNMDEAKKYGFDVGVYFYSYAYTNEEAINQAKYVIENLKGYDLKLPIVFDWECWNKFNKMNISLFDITNVQNTFLNYVEEKGYKSARYGSKNYLINAWQESRHLTWLAHYINETNYDGEYFMWQRCDTGKVNGINGAVDVDILYLDKYDL